MKDASEQHGSELGPKTPTEYQEYFELADQRPTFGEVNKTGRKNAGHDKNWDDAAQRVSPQGDGNPGPVTPVSGGADGDIPDPKTRSQYRYVTGGKKYSPEFGRVPDSEQTWKHTGPQGSGEMFPNAGPQTAAFKRPIKLGWKERYAHALNPEIPEDMGKATAPNTPQRRKQRRTED